ncbi:MAG TPA: hypothetical protein DCS60_00455 [Opitutae bacterium]|nr:hypothetical protein [Opitutae bacterium]
MFGLVKAFNSTFFMCEKGLENFFWSVFVGPRNVEVSRADGDSIGFFAFKPRKFVPRNSLRACGR